MSEIVVWFGLSDDEQRERSSSGAVRLNTNVSYAEQYLKDADLLVRPARGTWAITAKGRGFLADHPGPISIAELKALTDETLPLSSGDHHTQVLREPDRFPDDRTHPTSDAGPSELVDAGYQEMMRDLARELLESMECMSPDKFEHLVVDLLVNMGYGDGQSVGRSGDGGIDGIIVRDPLGLDKIYLQAKRWTSQVGEPEIRNFSGSLDAQGASTGVFITTSTFSSIARQTAHTVSSGNKHIRLVDGHELAQLMIRHGVGVVTEYTYEIKKLDENYFAEEI